MIQVALREDSFRIYLEVSGHADFAPAGKDLICAAVSAMAQMLEIGMKRLPDRGSVSKIKGHFVLESSFSEEARLLIDSFFESCRMLERQYPNHIRTQKNNLKGESHGS